MYLFIFLMVAFCSIAATPTVQGRITSYGLFRFPSKPVFENAPGAPEGISGKLARAPILISETNRVPAKTGVRFGLTFEITNMPVPDGVVKLTKIVRHPLMTKPDGTTSNQYTSIEKFAAQGGKVVGWTGYGLDLDYEIVTGDWEFEMQSEGKCICKQKFVVVKE